MLDHKTVAVEAVFSTASDPRAYGLPGGAHVHR